MSSSPRGATASKLSSSASRFISMPRASPNRGAPDRRVSRRPAVGLPPAHDRSDCLVMTRAQAEQRARRLQENDPDRDTHRFVAREGTGGEWDVARVEIPASLRRGTLTETVEAKPRPSPADDPGTGNERRMPGLP